MIMPHLKAKEQRKEMKFEFEPNEKGGHHETEL
jgi:hypothetical protein